MLDPKKLREKADILETNLFKTVSRQKDVSRIVFRINRAHFPDQVINKALIQLMPRLKVKPTFFILGLRELMQKEIGPDDKEIFYTELKDTEDTLYADEVVSTRTFEAVLTKDTLEITIKGVPAVPSIDGKIAKSFFNHELSAGKLSKGGVINFKEINRYPVVNAGDNLFYITPEKQGSPGISFNGKLLKVKEAVPLVITVGPGIEKVDDVDDASFQSKGYFLKALKTGVVILGRDDEGIIRDISISDEMQIKRLDYSVGNIGTQYTCPISAKVGIICNGFKIRVDGRIQADVSEGAHITTSSQADIALVQTGSVIKAQKDINIQSASGSRLQSEEGIITINHELIDSTVTGPAVEFNKSNGLLTNNTLECNKIKLHGLYFSGVNIIHFGSSLFDRKDELLKSISDVKNRKGELKSTE